MSTKFYAREGIIFKGNSDKPPKSGFDLERLIEWQLNKLHVPFVDSCCADSNDSVPVRENDGVLESFNPESGLWEAIDLGTFTATDLALDDGTVGDLAIKIGADGNNGIYGVSDTDLGVAVEGAHVASFNTSGILANSISEMTTGAGVKVNQSLINKHTAFPVNISATVSGANFVNGYFTSTSAAGVTLTLDTAANIATAIGAVGGTMMDFYVDNTAGANTVTVAVGSGITAATPVVTGGGTLTVSVANAIGVFRLVFSSATVAKLFRLG